MAKSKKNVFYDDSLFGDTKTEDSSSQFMNLLNESEGKLSRQLKVGDKLTCELLSIGKEESFASTGTLKDGLVLTSELKDDTGTLKYKVGDKIELYVLQIKGDDVKLSKSASQKLSAEELEDAFDMMLPVDGKVIESVNGGYRVQVLNKLAFCPFSQIDLKRADSPEAYIGKKFQFMITQFDPKGRNIVVSRRKILEEQQAESQAAFTEDHKVGDVVRGVVSRIEKFGAFVELAPGLEGLVHISELSFSRLESPSEAVKVGDPLSLKILKMETEGGRPKISLSLKQTQTEPWTELSSKIKEGQVVQGRVTKLLNFGAFVEILPGIEGLVPLGEMSYTKRVVKSDDLVKQNETISVMVKEIRWEDKKILLSLRDAGGDPWSMVAQKFPVGTQAEGFVEKKETYGLFVQLEPGITGLLPKSRYKEHVDHSKYESLKPGDKVLVQVSEIQFEARKLTFGIPGDAFDESWKEFAQGGSGQGAGAAAAMKSSQFGSSMSDQLGKLWSKK